MSMPTFGRPSVHNGSPGNAPVESPPSRRAPSTRALVAVALSAALLGAAAITGLLFAVGAIGDRVTGAVTHRATAPDGTIGTPSLDPTAIYANAAAGVVDITANGITPDSQGLPFAPGKSEASATGTGSILDTRGDILTASHVIAGASSITVKLRDGTRRRARVLGVDRSTDVAVLKIDPSGLALRPLALGSSQLLSVGNPIAIIGDPFEYNRSLSTGVVSALDRTIPAPNGFLVAHAIQTDASINPGNSGGPVLDARGHVVGIVDQIATGGSSIDSSTGVGFAIPIDVVKAELSQLERGVKVTHAYLGAATSQATQRQGALVEGVTAGSPAAAAGLRPGDIVTAIDGTTIKGPNSVVATIAGHHVGDKIRLHVRRGSTSLTLTTTLGAQPSTAG
jgi:S1-C subfamily serine protease